jgi:Helix-turn-helix domain
VSVEAISWALNLAPVPADRGGQPSSASKFVLVGLANHAGPDGTGAFPSVATLVRYTGLSERTVRTCLDRLQAESIISPCDPDIVAARIKRADRRPQGWDLNLGLVRNDPDDADVAVLEHQFPGIAARLAGARLGDDGQSDGVQSPHPEPGRGEVVDNSADGVQQVHPAHGTGCNQRTHGVQLTQPRGAMAAPEPYREPSREPSAAAPEAPPAPIAVGGCEPVGEYFAVLGSDWRLTRAQQARLAPAVVAALAAGWTPRELAEFTRGNTGDVRSPHAVLAARLAPGELPTPARQRPARPPWCGECDQAKRMLGFDGDAPSPCPRCKPHHGSEPRMTRPKRGAAPARTPGVARAAGAGLANAGQRPGGRDSVGPWAYDGTRAWRPKGVSRGG